MAILFRDIRLIDGLSPIAREHVDVRIDAGMVGAIAAHRQDGEPPTDDHLDVVDGAGRTLLPGLIDAHAHYTFDPAEGSLQRIAGRSDDAIARAAADHAARALGAGITTARGAGSIRNLEVALRDDIAAGRIVGPRLVVAGTAVGTIGGHGSAFGLEADGPLALAAATRAVIDGGADVVKAVASEAAMLTTTGLAPGHLVHGAAELTEAELRAVVDVATERGIRVMAHAQDGTSVIRSARAGVASVEHAWLADEAAIEGLAASGAFLVPTLIVTDVNRTLPGLTPAQRERQDRIERRHRASTETAIRLGVPVAAGTDTGEVGVTADLLWREIALLHDHGASPMEAIQAATSGAARLLGVAHEVGTVEVGRRADLVMVDGDPLADLRRLARPRLVVQGGRVVAGADGQGATPMNR